MKIIRFMTPILLLVTILLSSCNLSASTATATLPPGLNSNTLAQTIEALSTQSVSGQPTSAPISTETIGATPIEIPTGIETIEPTTLEETPTNTPVPTRSSGIPVVPITPIATLSSYNPPAAINTCNIGTFESDVTIPNYSNISAGSSFVKTWRILNSGTCTWDTGYQLFFSSGNSLSAPSSINLPDTVAPGQTVDLSVDMVAPSSAGSYRGSWLLRNDSGSVFGVGNNGQVPLTVLIVVGSTSTTTSIFAVTHIEMSVDTAASTVNCPPGHNFTFTGDIESNRAGSVTYYWGFSNGTKTSEKTLNFSSGSTQSVSTTWKLGTAGPESSNPFGGWARIYIDTPNHQFFSKENITLTCNSSASPSDTPAATAIPIPTETPTP
jgi:hypothetical protein